MNLLNLGCGKRYHPSWINIDVSHADPSVIKSDLNKGIPLPTCYCDAVYSTAVLEHFRIKDSLFFLKESFRVLKPGGVIRIGVPDLESLCRQYLKKLDAIMSGDETVIPDYDWILLELFDQVVREQSGGSMAAWLDNESLPNKDFIIERIGNEARDLIKNKNNQHKITESSEPLNLVKKIRRTISRTNFARLKSEILSRLLHEDDQRALAIGRFRLSGEVHQWSYDRFSLSRLLSNAGFSNPLLLDAFRSQIPDWGQYFLDVAPDGTVNKPDLLFMEAKKAYGIV